MNRNKYILFLLSGLLSFGLASCSDDENTDAGNETTKTDAEFIGKAIGNFLAEEWLPGGELGTTDNVSAGCYVRPFSSVTSTQARLPSTALALQQYVSRVSTVIRLTDMVNG